MNYNIFILCLALVTVVVVAEDECVSQGAADLRPDPNDCSVFYVCDHGKLVRFTCPSGVFNPTIKVCVQKGSIYDKCTNKEQSNSDTTCTPGSKDIIPNPTNCAQYYDCGDNSIPFRWPKYLKECPYEQLYNTNTKRCEHYSMVDCGKRWEPVSYCDYLANQCVSAHCVPCHVHNPECKGLPNGLNIWKGRENSPYYVVCKNNRTVYQGMCKQNNGYYVYDDNLKSCVKKNE